MLPPPPLYRQVARRCRRSADGFKFRWRRNFDGIMRHSQPSSLLFLFSLVFNVLLRTRVIIVVMTFSCAPLCLKDIADDDAEDEVGYSFSAIISLFILSFAISPSRQS